VWSSSPTPGWHHTRAAHHYSRPPSGCTPGSVGAGRRPRGCRRHWTSQRLSRTSVPLTGATALQSDTPWVSTTMLAFPRALAAEADDVAPRRFAFESTVQAVGIN
jgi:hypothetical protein